MSLSFFTADESRIVPTEVACSLWSADQMHGVAMSGALARGLEFGLAERGRTELRPARYSVEMFQPARMQPVETEWEVVRESARLCLIDARLVQDGEAVARASCIFLAPTANPDGEIWAPDIAPEPPPIDLAPVSDEPTVPFFASDAAWSQDFTHHQNGGRKVTWQTAVPVVAGEDPTGFTAAASIADATSMVVNWGSKGVTYINTDITMNLSRLPVSNGIGLMAVEHTEHDGIATGVAVMFDREGRIGSTAVAGLANAKRTVDLSAAENPERYGSARA